MTRLPWCAKTIVIFSMGIYSTVHRSSGSSRSENDRFLIPGTRTIARVVSHCKEWSPCVPAKAVLRSMLGKMRVGYADGDGSQWKELTDV